MKVGDKIEVDNYTATCQKVEGNIALFCMDQYLDEAMPMNGDSYETSELRKRINSDDILKLFDSIRDRMFPFENGDYLRIPYAEEIFDPEEINWIKEERHPKIEQWEPMKDRRNVVCFRKNEWEWGWLMNKIYAENFAVVYRGGYSDCHSAEYSGGVRLVFQLINNTCDQSSINYRTFGCIRTIKGSYTVNQPENSSKEALDILTEIVKEKVLKDVERYLRVEKIVDDFGETHITATVKILCKEGE